MQNSGVHNMSENPLRPSEMESDKFRESKLARTFFMTFDNDLSC